MYELSKVEMMKSTGRLRLTFSGYFAHYFFVLIISIPALFHVGSFIEYFNGTYKGFHPIEEVFFGAVPFLIVAFLVFLWQYHRLKFKIIENTLSPQRVLELCRDLAEVNKWKVVHQTATTFVAKADWIFYPEFLGEMITVIAEDNKVFINSICDPYKKPNILSYGMNRKYRKAIIKEIERAGR